MPAEACWIMPARSISRCETICASAGVSLMVGRNSRERRMATGSHRWNSANLGIPPSRRNAREEDKAARRTLPPSTRRPAFRDIRRAGHSVCAHMRVRFEAVIATLSGCMPAWARRRPRAANPLPRHGTQGSAGIRLEFPGHVVTEARISNGCSFDDCGSPALASLQTRGRQVSGLSRAPLVRNALGTGVAPTSGTRGDWERPAGRPSPIRRWRPLGYGISGNRMERAPMPASPLPQSPVGTLLSI